MLGHWPMPPNATEVVQGCFATQRLSRPATTEREFPLVSFIRSRLLRRAPCGSQPGKASACLQTLLMS
jgi:hypothetical protein